MTPRAASGSARTLPPLPAGWPHIPDRHIAADLWPLSRCPECGGGVMTILGRAWCERTYADGGCGTAFYRRARRSERAGRGGSEA